MPQYKYQVRKVVKWMAKFNYLDPKTGKTETKYNVFEKHIFPTFKENLIDEITDDDIAEWQTKIKSTAKPNGKHFQIRFCEQSKVSSIRLSTTHIARGISSRTPLRILKIWA